MIIEIKNPMITIIRNNMIVKYPIKEEQAKRQIEKLMLSKSIIAEEINIK